MLSGAMGGAVGLLWDDSPAVTRLLSVGYATLSPGLLLAARLLPGAGTSLLCCLEVVLGRKCVLPLFLSFIYRPIQNVPSLLMTGLEVYLGLAYLPERERDLGSVRFLAWALLTTVAFNVVFLFSMLLLSVVDSRLWLNCNQGFWPLIVVCMTLRALMNPREPVSVLNVAYVPSRWYPAMMTVILSVLSGRILWDVCAALAVGYAHDALQLDQILPSPSRVARWERRRSCQCICGLLHRVGAYIPAQGARGYGDLEGGVRRYATLSDLRASAQVVGVSRSEVPPFLPSSA
mmetsp:Transcript_96254/g.248933  ORF Transcript_96254/g.248933 Transcript_96254/m.248933 type:complete len:290 (-) Transcript_96254:299-1168(-)